MTLSDPRPEFRNYCNPEDYERAVTAWRLRRINTPVEAPPGPSRDELAISAMIEKLPAAGEIEAVAANLMARRRIGGRAVGLIRLAADCIMLGREMQKRGLRDPIPWDEDDERDKAEHRCTTRAFENPRNPS